MTVFEAYVLAHARLENARRAWSEWNLTSEGFEAEQTWRCMRWRKDNSPEDERLIRLYETHDTKQALDYANAGYEAALAEILKVRT